MAHVALSAYLADHQTTFSGGLGDEASKNSADGKSNMLDVNLRDLVVQISRMDPAHEKQDSATAVAF